MPEIIKGQTTDVKKQFFQIYFEGNNNNIIGFKRIIYILIEDNSGWSKWLEEQQKEIVFNITL